MRKGAGYGEVEIMTDTKVTGESSGGAVNNIEVWNRERSLYGFLCDLDLIDW